MEHHRPVDMLYFDLNSYFASAEQHDDPSLRGRPVAVIPGREATPGSACIAASYEAKARGVGMGVRVGEARALCPGIVFRPARHDRYVELHHAIKAAVERVLPVEKTCSIDEFACRLAGPQRELDQGLALAREIKRRIARDLGPALRASIGLGPNALLAKIAGELQKPDGLCWILPGEQLEKLGPLPLRALPGIGANMEVRLIDAGVRSVAELLALAPRHARAIWGGVQGERFLRALRGEEIPDPVTRKGMIGHSQVLAPQSRNPWDARMVLRRLLVKAASRLRRTGMFATRLSIRVKTVQDARAGRETGFHATQDTLVLLKAMEREWDALPPRMAPRHVAVTLHGLVRREAHIRDLFEDRSANGALTEREALFETVDALNQRYGRDTLVFGETPKTLAPFTGAKIAFNRVPEAVEFRE